MPVRITETSWRAELVRICGGLRKHPKELWIGSLYTDFYDCLQMVVLERRQPHWSLEHTCYQVLREMLYRTGMSSVHGMLLRCD